MNVADIKALIACVHGERLPLSWTTDNAPDVIWCSHCGAVSIDDGKTWERPSVLASIVDALADDTA